MQDIQALCFKKHPTKNTYFNKKLLNTVLVELTA